MRQDIAGLSPEQLPIAVRYIREDVEVATRMLQTGLGEKEQPLDADQHQCLRRFVDDQTNTLEDLVPEAMFEAVRVSVPDAFGRAYLALTDRLD